MNRYLYLIRKRIAEIYEHASPFQGEIEVDESYFGAKGSKGSVVAVPVGKLLYSASCNEIVYITVTM